MSDKTGISWTDATWNPLVGCTRVSEGCRNCYAERVAATRMKGVPAYDGIARVNADGEPRWTGFVKLLEDRLDQPLRWKRPRMVFVNSMSDLFHESVSFAMIDRIFAVMALAPHHIFQVLTKRPERMEEYMRDRSWDIPTLAARELYGHPRHGLHLLEAPEPPLSNVWLGVSVEDHQTTQERIPPLLQTPAAVRWISAEPLLGHVDLTDILLLDDMAMAVSELDWIVVGGESGPHARPMSPYWARVLRDQACESGVPFHFKQWGEWVPSDTHDDDTGKPKIYMDDAGVYGGWVERVGKRAAGRKLDGRIWDEWPAVVEVTT